MRSVFSTSRGNRPAHLELGRKGEEQAARHLRRLGYKVLYRNFKPDDGGEIDLVCRDKKTLVFVEVKTRRSGGPGRPADAVDRAKEEAIARGAAIWLRMLGNPDIPVRFDVVEVLMQDGRAVYTVTQNAARQESSERA